MRALLYSSLCLLIGCVGRPEVQRDAGRYDPDAGNRYDEPLILDDTRVLGMNDTQLPSTPEPCRFPSLGQVVEITDGDTLRIAVPYPPGGPGVPEPGDAGFVAGMGRADSYRLIGVDTPEVSHLTSDGGTDNARQCFGEDARAFTERLRGRWVWLTFDRECFDRNGRWLAYLWVGPGEGDMWQRQMLERGFAGICPIAPNTTYAAELAEREARARAAGLGVWGACGSVAGACN